MLILYKLMLVFSIPKVLLTSETFGVVFGSAISGWGIAHGGAPIILFIPSAIVFYILMLFQCITIAVHFTKYKTVLPIKIMCVVLLFQAIDLFFAVFYINFYRYHTLLSGVEFVLFVLVSIYVVKFFSSEKAKKS